MSTGKFLILVAFSFIIFALVSAEVLSEAQVAGLTQAVSMHETNLERVQRQQEVLRAMLQKLAIASLTDPDLAEVLRDHGVHVNRHSTQVESPAAAPAGAKPAPAAPEVPAVAQ